MPCGRRDGSPPIENCFGRGALGQLSRTVSGRTMRNRRNRRRSILRVAAGPGDFLPLVIAVTLLFVSVPGFLVLLLTSERLWGVIETPLLIILGGGIVIGFCFLVLGVRLCSEPGSLAYRLAHGRIFFR